MVGTRVVGVAACLLGALVLSHSERADACHNGVEIRTDPRVASMQEAERLVDAGDSAAAARKVKAIDPEAAKRQPGASGLSDRGLLVLTRATVRGDTGMGLPWAIDTLRAFKARRGDDPTIVTYLGEALSHDAKTHAEGLTILSSLESRDVMANAHGYAALARLNANVAADKPSYLRAPLRALVAGKREIELSRCAEMTKAEGVCGPRGTAPSSAAATVTKK